MSSFSGFPSRSKYTPIPNILFSGLLPLIDDIDELKVLLQVFQTLYLKKGYPKFVSFGELLEDKALATGLKKKEGPLQETLTRALGKCVERSTVIHIVIDRQGRPEDIYLLNNEDGRRAADKIRSGELVPAGLKAAPDLGTSGEREEVPDIFTLYEENIGMLTPIISEELVEAEKLYPKDWIQSAIKEAASLNKRSWRYISRILENWAEEGRSDGAHRGDTKTGQDKHGRSNYGQIFRR